ncbi:hypothetical protein JS82_06720 [Methanomassiliicoccaceae archaeon DOK]|nr:hypothetical protein JS82_06720 [Methanomassiliicoccaceae archaeon DOK]
MNKTNNGKLIAAVAVLALIACAFMAAGVASEESDGALASQMTGEQFLAEAGQGVITLDKDVELTSQVDLNKSLTINLNGFTLSSADNVGCMFYNANGEKGASPGTANITLTINGEEEGSAIDASGRIVFLRADNCSLEITGGTYTTGEYGFIWYDVNTDTAPTNTINVENITINTVNTAFWLSNAAIAEATFTNCDITTGELGIYLATVQKATVTNCDITTSGASSESAIEIKAGDIAISGCTLSSARYVESDESNNNGSGASISTLTINNNYSNPAETDAINVTVKDTTITNSAASSKPVILTSVNNVPIFFAWEGHDAKDVAITGTNDDSITIGSVTGGETSVEAGDVATANSLLTNESVDKVVLNGTIDATSAALSVPANKTLVIADGTSISGTDTNPISIADGGVVEVNTTSSAAKTFTVKGGSQTNGVKFVDVSGNFTVTGGSVHVEGNISGTIENNNEDDVYINGTIDGDLNVTGTGTLTFVNATITNGATITLDDGITYLVNGNMRVYGSIMAADPDNDNVVITVNKSATEPKNSLVAYAGATIGKGVIVNGDGEIDISAAMSTITINDDIESDSEWSQSQKVVIGDTLTIKSGYKLVVLGELVINENCTIIIEKGAQLIVGDDTVGKEILATGVTVNGTIDVENGGIFKVANAKDVTVTGDIISEGTVDINSTVTIENGGSILINDSISTGSESTLNVDKGLTVEVGGELTISSKFTAAAEGIYNKGTVTLDNALISGATVINMAGDGAVVDVRSVYATQSASLRIQDNGLVFDEKKNDVVDGTTVNETNAIHITLDANEGVSGLLVTESVVSITEDDAKLYSNSMIVSGSINAEENGTVADLNIIVDIRGAGRTDAGAGGIYIEAESSLTVGEDATTRFTSGTLNVDGELTVTADGASIEFFGSDEKEIDVTGTIVSKSAITVENNGKINAFHYSTSGTGAANYYTNLTAALASGATTIDFMGKVQVLENATIPDGTRLDGNGTMVIGSEDNRDVTVTVANGGSIRNGNVTVLGTLVFENAKRDDRTTVTSDVVIETEPVKTYTNVYTALNNATDGKVTVRGTVFLNEDIEVKAGVTLVIPSGANVYLDNGVTMTVNGTVENSGIIDSMILNPDEATATTIPYVDGDGFQPVTDPTDEREPAAIVVNGALKSMENVPYNAYYIPGAYYQIIDTDGAWYWITPVEAAADVASTVENGIQINGEIVVADIDFAGSIEDGADPVTVTVTADGKLTAGTISLSRAILDVDGQFDGTVDSALGSIAFVNATNFVVTDGYDSDDVEYMAVSGTPVQADDEGADASMVIATGSIVVNDATNDLNIVSSATIGGAVHAGLETFEIAEGATLTVTGNGVVLKADEMTVDGTLVAIDSGAVNVTSLTVRGTFTVAEKTDDNNAGSASITTLYIGIATNEDGEFVDASAGAVTADNLGGTLNTVYVSAQSTFTGKLTESMDSTGFYVEDSLWMTVYEKTGSNIVKSAATSSTPATYNFVPGELESSKFVAWTTADGKLVPATAKVGDENYRQVYANIDYEVYNVVVVLDNTVGSVAIDGQLLSYIPDLGGYILPGGTELKAGQHTVTYTLAANYEGTPVLSSSNVTVSGMTFTLSGDFEGADGTPVVYYLSLGGATPADTTVVIEGGNGGSDSLGLTDYLLIILVVLIVIMAIMVAMRLMRS